MKRNANRAAAAMLAVLLILLCAGCSRAKPAEEPAPAPAQTETPTPAAEQPPAEEPTEEPAEETADVPGVYALVLDEACAVLYNGMDYDEEYRSLSTGVMEAAVQGEGETLLRELGYALQDLSGDGVPELLIARSDGTILGGYTIGSDGEIIQFLDGWARNRYYLLNDGRFYNSGSGGAMSSAFGTYHLSADGTELVCEEHYFTAPKDESWEEIGLYRNETGEWDPAVSEELDVTEEEFWTRASQLERCAVLPELTPFASYAYMGFIEQPLDCRVRVDYLEDVVYRLGTYDDLTGTVSFDDPAAAEWATPVAFRAKEDVSDFRLLTLELRDVDDAGHAAFAATETYAAPALTAERPLAAPLYFPGDMPSNGFAYTDADGAEQYFAISASGKDGSLIVTPLTAADGLLID